MIRGRQNPVDCRFVGAVVCASPMSPRTDSIDVRVSRAGSIEVPLPRYQTTGAAGMDLHAAIPEAIRLESLERRLVPTGLRMAIPEGYEAQVRPRSGLAAKHGITVLNTPGTIDSDYRGELAVCLVNLSKDAFEVKPLERIAQIVFARHARAELAVVTSLDETARGEGGYGSTGR
jgi:dUTP pyrophosphatase